ncbi:glycosyltransferase [Phaeovulum sp.]|uniref:glycosyltransferase n=1 Tax=Phaeovulum sp. TaxID=2934796 RepID=UPI0039E3F7FC
MASTLPISVIVPHLNQSEALGCCLRSLAAQTGLFDLAEVIVVDNGSHVLPHDVCARFPGVRLLAELTPGPGPARNTGVGASSGAILAFVDADCVADAGWLAAITRIFASDPQVGILGGAVFIPRATERRTTALEAYEMVYAYRMDKYISQQGFTGAGNLAVRREVFEAVGPFGGVAISEDRDWGLRATGLGHAIRYVPDMVVYHPARTSFDALQLKWDRHIAHDFNRLRDKFLWRPRTFLRAIAVGLSPLAEIPKLLLTSRLIGLRERGLAFMCLFRIRLHRARRMIGLIASDSEAELLSRWNRN